MSVFLGVVLPTILLLTSPLQPQFVPGEILAKFVRGTEGDAAVNRASQVTPPDLGVLVPVVKSLQAKTGVPLRAIQIMGGNWLRLSIDSDELTDSLVRKLRARPNIAEVKVGAEPPEGPGGISAPKTLAITFSPGTTTSKTADQLIRELEQDLDLPLLGEASTQGGVRVRVDLRTLTPMLADQIRALCDIESAQLNYVVTIK